MSRFARKVDSNHRTIIEAFEAMGCEITDTSRVGGGFPDLIVTLDTFVAPQAHVLVEVKDGSRPPGERRLTPAQVEFRAHHPRLRIVTVLSVEDVQELVRNLRQPLRRAS